MADNIQEQNQQQQEGNKNNESATLIAENMRQSIGLFGGKLPAAANSEGQQNSQQKESGEGQKNNAAEAAAPEANPFNIFKEKYQWQTPEDAFKEIEELRAGRDKYNAPTSIEDIEFDNPASEKLYRAIVGGKTKEVYNILHQQDRLDTLT